MSYWDLGWFVTCVSGRVGGRDLRVRVGKFRCFSFFLGTPVVPMSPPWEGSEMGWWRVENLPAPFHRILDTLSLSSSRIRVKDPRVSNSRCHIRKKGSLLQTGWGLRNSASCRQTPMTECVYRTEPERGHGTQLAAEWRNWACFRDPLSSHTKTLNCPERKRRMGQPFFSQESHVPGLYGTCP